MKIDQKLIKELRESNPWLAPFNLSDDDFYNASLYVSRVLLGSDKLEDFIPNLNECLSHLDPEIIKKIALEAARENFWNMREDIGDVEGFIKGLGGNLPAPPKEKNASGDGVVEKVPTDYLIKADTNTTEINIPSNSSKGMAFSTMDEEEVKNIQVPQTDTYRVDYDTLADDIISKFRYNESDEILHKRLSNIIISRFRDVRDEFESIDALTKSKKVGGMELTSDQATQLLKLIKEEQESFKKYHISSGEAVQRIEFAVKKPIVARPEVKVKTLEEKRDSEMGKVGVAPVPQYVRSTPVMWPKMETVVVPLLTKEGQGEVMKAGNQDSINVSNKVVSKPLPASPWKGEETTSEKAPVMDEEDGLPILRMPEDVMVKPKMVEIVNKKVVQEEIKNPAPINSVPVAFKREEPQSPLPQPAPYVTAGSIPPRVMESQNTRRPIVDGIKLAKKLTGPIEELSDMTLIDFRRLAPNPTEAIGAIKEKIELLQEESYSRRAEGIEAWFRSEVSKFYRLLGQTSMIEGKNIDDIIKERLLSGKPTLSIEEFNAIMQLNSEIRY